jgi:type III secretion system low calcium response chaperone LcrH/SycD
MTQTAPDLEFHSPELDDLLGDLTAAGVTLAQLKGITDEELEAAYVLGYRAYVAGDYVAAFRVFRYLCTFSHTSARFWHALAACQQMLKSHDAAAQSYIVAFTLGGDPAEILHAAECRLAADDKAAARAFLRAVVATADDPARTATRERAASMLALLDDAAS